MNGLPVPERAHLMPSRPEEAEYDDSESNFNAYHLLRLQNRHLPHLYLVQRLLSFFVLETPSLPVTNAHYIRNSRTGEDRPPEYLRQNSQRSLQGRKIPSNRPNGYEDRDLCDGRKEQQRPSFEPELSVKDSREEAHSARKNDLANQLQAMLGDDTDTFVLLCWGKEYECSIIPVKISDADNETVIWRKVRKEWCSRRVWWRRYFSFFCVQYVDLVEIHIVGMNSRKSSGPRGATEFLGMYTKKNLQTEKKRLERIIDNYREQEYPCPYDSSTGRVECFTSCVSYEWNDFRVQCPEEVKFKAQRQLENLKTQPLMRLAFSDSKLASSNDFLQGENLVYGHRDTLMMMDEWHCPKLREMEFRGIFVKEEWEVKSHYVLFSLAMTLLCSILIAAKFVFGEWGTAWTVGSFFLSLGSSLYGMMNIELAR